VSCGASRRTSARGRLRAARPRAPDARDRRRNDSQGEAAARSSTAQQLVLAAVRRARRALPHDDLAALLRGPRAGRDIATRQAFAREDGEDAPRARSLDRLRAELARGRGGGEPWIWSAVLAPTGAARAARAGVLGSLGGALMTKKLLAAAVVLRGPVAGLDGAARGSPLLAEGEPVAESCEGELCGAAHDQPSAPRRSRSAKPVPAVAAAPTPASDVRDASATATLLVTVRHAVLEPAPGIGLALWPVDAPQPDLALARGGDRRGGHGALRGARRRAPIACRPIAARRQSVVLARGEARELGARARERGVDVEGVVLDPDGAPLAGAELRLAAAHAGAVGRVHRRTQRRADGTFTLARARSRGRAGRLRAGLRALLRPLAARATTGRHPIHAPA
jgi:hypothetical protein